jgi:hypothetical protein
MATWGADWHGGTGPIAKVRFAPPFGLVSPLTELIAPALLGRVDPLPDIWIDGAARQVGQEVFLRFAEQCFDLLGGAVRTELIEQGPRGFEEPGVFAIDADGERARSVNG